MTRPVFRGSGTKGIVEAVSKTVAACAFLITPGWGIRRARVSLLAMLAVTAAGCAIQIRPTTVSVPQTPEAQKCWRECEQIKETCLGKCRARGLINYGVVKRCVEACADNRDQCLRGCPGAVDAQAQQ